MTTSPYKSIFGRPGQVRTLMGLISGTSMDAIEAAICKVSGTDKNTKLQLIRHLSVPLPAGYGQRVRSAQTASELCSLNFEVGELFARAAQKVLRAARLNPSQIHAIGSHGQTVAHRKWSTLQVGEGTVIAQKTGIPVISNFREADVALHGQGAPLVPYFDWVMFRKPGSARALHNIGGISNVSCVTSKIEDTIAFDTGPGNMVLDAVVRLLTKGEDRFDDQGSLARKGNIVPSLLKELLRHPFFDRKPPRSAGSAEFGETLAEALFKEHRRKIHDLLSTLVEFTAVSTAQAYEQWIFPHRKLEGIYVSGGGCRNSFLMERLKIKLAPHPIYLLDTLGFRENAKEAACFALLAHAFLNGTPANIPSTTGAAHFAVLGKLNPPPSI